MGGTAICCSEEATRFACVCCATRGWRSRVVQRNLLMQCMFLPVERDKGFIVEEGESDGEIGGSGIELEAEEGTGGKRCDGLEEMLDRALIGTADKEEEQMST